MATIQKRGKHQYRVLIRRTNPPRPMAKTSDCTEQAKQWAREVEAKLDQGQTTIVLGNKLAAKMTLHQALEKYLELKTPLKLRWQGSHPNSAIAAP